MPRKPVLTWNDFMAKQQDLMRKAEEAREQKIWPGQMAYDDDADCEILHSEEVYKDLKQLEKVLEKNQAIKDSLGNKAVGRR